MLSQYVIRSSAGTMWSISSKVYCLMQLRTKIFSSISKCAVVSLYFTKANSLCSFPHSMLKPNILKVLSKHTTETPISYYSPLSSISRLFHCLKNLTFKYPLTLFANFFLNNHFSIILFIVSQTFHDVSTYPFPFSQVSVFSLHLQPYLSFFGLLRCWINKKICT